MKIWLISKPCLHHYIHSSINSSNLRIYIILWFLLPSMYWVTRKFYYVMQWNKMLIDIRYIVLKEYQINQLAPNFISISWLFLSRPLIMLVIFLWSKYILMALKNNTFTNNHTQKYITSMTANQRAVVNQLYLCIFFKVTIETVLRKYRLLYLSPK